MPSGMRVAGQVPYAFLVNAALIGALVGALWLPNSGRAMQEPGDEAAQVRIVHGIANASPLDVYVDGALALIGVVFGDTSGDLVFAAGQHEFTVVPTGATPTDAIASGTITLQSNSRSYAVLLGTVDAASVGIFAIDDRPLDQGRARFRVISGVPDAGEIVPVLTGGDALSEPLGFGDASEYAGIDAGAYDLDILEAASGVSLLALPQTPLDEGTTIDLILVGQVSDASLLALVQPIQVEIARVMGRSAQIITGDCDAPGDAVADLGVVQQGQGNPVGAAGTDPVAQGFGVAGIPFAALLASPHAVTVAEDRELGGDVVACGEIGGNLTDTGALVMPLHTADSASPGGIAVLAPALEDPDTTGVSIFLTAGVVPTSTLATPVAAIE